LAQARFAELDQAADARRRRGRRPLPGHPWVYPHSLYAAAYFGLTYRDTVALKASRYAVDCVHSSRNLEPEDLEGLLRLEPLLPGDSIPRRG